MMNITQLICKHSSCFHDRLTLSEHAYSLPYRGLGQKRTKNGAFC